MGIVERKEREKEEMRRLMLDAALTLFREKGLDAVSIRNIAEMIEYSPATIYLYYKDKSEILSALQYEAAAVKRSHLMSAALIENPWERLIEFGRRPFQPFAGTRGFFPLSLSGLPRQGSGETTG